VTARSRTGAAPEGRRRARTRPPRPGAERRSPRPRRSPWRPDRPRLRDRRRSRPRPPFASARP
jgi:hypothetical protein